MTRTKPELLPDPDELFNARLNAAGQRLVRPDGLPLSVELFARYWATDQKSPARCPVCLRIYDATPMPGGQPRGYCSTYCRAWASDTRRRTHPRQWLTCEECGHDLFAVDDRPACPPAAPVTWRANTECRTRRKLRLDAEACRRWRQRLAAFSVRPTLGSVAS